VIRNLVDTAELTYTYEHGCSFIEPSFARPVALSSKVIVKPPNVKHDAGADEFVVDLHPGASFGNGRHPTTRLAVRGVEFVLLDATAAGPDRMRDILDIGSGSGILLLTALAMGVGSGMGIDTDPCARVETKKNIDVNGFSKRAVVVNRDLSSIRYPFSMVAANLRYPSLVKLSERIAGLTLPEGFTVLSGIKTEEVTGLKDAFLSNGLVPIWERIDRGWAAVVLQKENS